LGNLNNFVLGDEWRDGNWHRFRVVSNMTNNTYKSIWPIILSIPPHSSITVEIALFMIIPGVHDNVDDYIEPICNL